MLMFVLLLVLNCLQSIVAFVAANVVVVAVVDVAVVFGVNFLLNC